jgi:hypothetical protein
MCVQHIRQKQTGVGGGFVNPVNVDSKWALPSHHAHHRARRAGVEALGHAAGLERQAFGLDAQLQAREAVP